MTMFYIGFEVKTGKRKGFYIAVHEADKALQDMLIKAGWGRLDLIQNLDFYRKHSLHKDSWTTHYQIWTHTRFASHEFNRGVWTELKARLGTIVKAHYV